MASGPVSGAGSTMSSSAPAASGCTSRPRDLKRWKWIARRGAPPTSIVPTRRLERRTRRVLGASATAVPRPRNLTPSDGPTPGTAPRSASVWTCRRCAHLGRNQPVYRSLPARAAIPSRCRAPARRPAPGASGRAGLCGSSRRTGFPSARPSSGWRFAAPSHSASASHSVQLSAPPR